MMAVPMSRDWQAKLRSGKADITRILQQLKSEGQVLKYRTQDDRLLTWVAEPAKLAFCIPCLRLMQRDVKSGRIINRCD